MDTSMRGMSSFWISVSLEAVNSVWNMLCCIGSQLIDAGPSDEDFVKQPSSLIVSVNVVQQIYR